MKVLNGEYEKSLKAMLSGYFFVTGLKKKGAKKIFLATAKQ